MNNSPIFTRAQFILHGLLWLGITIFVGWGVIRPSNQITSLATGTPFYMVSLSMNPGTALTQVGHSNQVALQLDTNGQNIHHIHLVITYPALLLKVSTPVLSPDLCPTSTQSAAQQSEGRLVIDCFLPTSGNKSQISTVTTLTWQAIASGLANLTVDNSSSVSTLNSDTSLLRVFPSEHVMIKP